MNGSLNFHIFTPRDGETDPPGRLLQTGADTHSWGKAHWTKVG